MQKGDVIRARFMTLPDLFPGKGCEEKKFPIRKGTVVYVHPKGRYIVAECGGCECPECESRHIGSGTCVLDQNEYFSAAADLIENQQRHIEALMKANDSLKDAIARRDKQLEDMNQGMAQRKRRKT